MADTCHSRFHRLVALCAALVLLSLAAHLLADMAWGAPFLPVSRPPLHHSTCYLLDSLALPMLIIMLAPLSATCLLACPVLICRGWQPIPPFHPPLGA